MNISRDALEASYGFCRHMSRQAGSNFHAGFLLLSKEKCRAMEALYAFMRHTDDLADDVVLHDDRRRELIVAWRTALDRALRGELPLPVSPSLLPALADTVERFHIPRKYLDAVIDGVEMDLTPQRYETFDELRVYCERVASAVGLACIHIWGFRGPEAFEPARAVGIALQLTNILRDLKEDADAGRVYLPLAELRQCGYSVDDLQAGVDDERFHRLMADEVARAEQFYRDGARLWDWLEPDGQRIFGLMTTTYHALLRKIAQRPGAVFRGHVRLSRLKKLQLVVRWSFLPPQKVILQ